jgi:serine protease Do
LKRSRLLAGSAAGVALAAAVGAGYWSGASAAPRDLSAPASEAPLTASPPSFANLIQRVAPAVVSIDVTRRGGREAVQMLGQGNGGEGDDQDSEGGPTPGAQDAFPNFPNFPNIPGFSFRAPGAGPNDGRDLPVEKATGSGFFISQTGYIVTNNHVVEGATAITVRTADNRTLKARLIGRDPATDLAVVKVEGDNFSYVSFEDHEKPRVGDWVIAVGNPYDLGGTATAGIVSALARENVSGSGFVDYMQIDAPINRGNSGGPTFDVYGRVVGVNSAIYSPSGGSVGIGFAIPADVAQSVTRQLIASGKVARGYIGATIQTVNPDIAASLGLKAGEGALVADLTPGGPSERAGLQVGDVITGVDGQPVRSANSLTQRVALVHAGDELRLEILRNGKAMTLTLRSGLRPSEAQLASNNQEVPGAGPGAPSAHARVLGMSLAPLDRAAREQFGIDRAGAGAVVTGVGRNSDAAEKGLQVGDLIVRAGAQTVTSPGDLSSAVAEAKRAGRSEVLLLVARNGRTVFIPVKVGSDNG